MMSVVGLLRRSYNYRTIGNLCRCCASQKSFSISSIPLYPAQPTAYTHPHLLNENEVTPGLPANVFHSRRQNFMNLISDALQMSLKECEANIVIIPSSTTVYMSEIIPYIFRQNTDFLYLSGFKETNCVLLLCTNKNYTLEWESVMFVPKSNSHTDRWEGKRMDLHTAKDFLQVDNILYMDDLQNFLQTFAMTHKRFTVWYDNLVARFSLIHQVMQDFISSYNSNIFVESPRTVMHKLRLIKSDPEIKLMRKVCKITADSMNEVMRSSKPSVLESHLHAKMDYESRLRGADYLAFPPVVAGADRAHTIHYIANNQKICDGEMVLMDAGCEYSGYCSDMARTWPVNGKFSDPQREIYELVLKVQEYLIKQCKPEQSLDNLFKIMCQLMGQDLQKLGILSPSATKAELSQAAYEFCPHHVSHYLGMDVHDTNIISCAIDLQPGMIITVEPGIYISSKDSRVPPKYRGICVRIEDDILITEDGYEILTSACPKQVDEVESLLVSQS